MYGLISSKFSVDTGLHVIFIHISHRDAIVGITSYELEIDICAV